MSVRSVAAIAPGNAAVVAGGASGIGLAAASRLHLDRHDRAARAREASRRVDAKRVAWAAGDVIENRPALSRWHPDWKGAFARFVED